MNANPWFILSLLVALALAFWWGDTHGRAGQLETDQLAAARLSAERDETDRKAREKYAAELETQRAKIAELDAKNKAAAAQYAVDLREARAKSAPITREVVRYVAENPSSALCRVPARLLELRRAQIRAANAAGGQPAHASSSGLRRVGEGHPARTAGADFGRSERDRAGRRLHHPDVWRSAAATDRARRMC